MRKVTKLAAAIGIICSPFAVTADSPDIRDLLLARKNEFREELIRVSEHVYTSNGFGAQPVSMIVGDDGIVIVDTNIDVSSAMKSLEKFREVTDKPVKAIIITHGHLDHTGGVAAFADEGTQIWARDNLGAEERPLNDAGVTITRARGARQGGIFLTNDEFGHIGIIPRYFPESFSEGGNLISTGPVMPTHTFSQQARIEVAGLKLDLVAASGETADQLYVWFEEDRVVFSGDNFYRSWPNLYALRGTSYRDVLAWIDSLNSMLEKNPHHLVGGHTRPVVGESETTQVLTNYRDAVKYVFYKTIEGMNKGLTPDEVVLYAALPDMYRQLDYLKPYYGHPDWGVRAIFNAYVGWFDGNPTNLFPLPPIEEAERMAELAGGEELLRQSFNEAANTNHLQWALQLSDYLLRLSPNDHDLKLAKADVLDRRAEQELNTAARNYYRQYAMELRQAVDSAE